MPGATGGGALWYAGSMLFHRLATLAALALAGATLTAAGCGGSSPGTITGSVKGTTLGVNDTVTGIYDDNGNSAVIVVLTTETNACATFTSGESVKNATSLVVAIAQYDPAKLKSVAPTATGTFTVYDASVMLVPPSADVATLSWYQSDSNCKSTLDGTGATGTVTISGVNNGAYSGTGDVTFDSGDHVTFTFDGTSCAAITTAEMGLQTTICM